MAYGNIHIMKEEEEKEKKVICRWQTQKAL